MFTSNLNKGTTIVRSGSSFARGVMMDLLLSEQDAATLLKKWDPSWGTPYTFQGGIQSLSAEQVAAVPLEELVRVYGKKFAPLLSTIAKKNAAV